MRSKDTHAATDRFATPLVLEGVPLIPEVLQLPSQCHLGLEKHLTLCVLKRLCHREAPSERSRIGQVRIHGRA